MRVNGKSIGVIPGKEFIDKFGDYYYPLSSLEAAFNLTGLDIEFDLKSTSKINLWVTINYKGGVTCNISILGDSPAQAIKDIAEAVSL